MSYKPKQFHVRGFAVTNTFDSRGFMNAQPTFVEEVARTQHQATVKMLTNGTLASMVNPLIMDIDPTQVIDRPVDEVKLKIYTDLNKMPKKERERVFKMVVAWAEKSRIRGKRGWRASAVREIRWERDEQTSRLVGHTTVLLGTQIFYSNDQSTLSPSDVNDFSQDVALLNKELGRAGNFHATSKHVEFGQASLRRSSNFTKIQLLLGGGQS